MDDDQIPGLRSGDLLRLDAPAAGWVTLDSTPIPFGESNVRIINDPEIVIFLGDTHEVIISGRDRIFLLITTSLGAMWFNQRFLEVFDA